MFDFKSTTTGQISGRTRGLLLATVFIIGASAIVLGGISLRRTVYGPYAVKTTATDLFASNDNSAVAKVDTDGDGLYDSDEINIYHTSPYLADSDSDGISDGQEIANGTDPNCPTGQNCSLIGSTDTAGTNQTTTAPSLPSIPGTTATPTPDELRTALRQAGASEQEIAGLTDEQIVASYQQALAAQSGTAASGSTQTPKELQNLSPSQIRDLLRQNGVDEATLSKLSDADLLKLYQQTLDQLNAQQ
ncbi:hypothetical protein COV04_00190 [Candidatus Uhrbacteria bacterium CG10_big_fil_rev_8_21_14_0_10_48_11]|uniref:Uncharacterized protein n=1 Tax=Candidatus Uhrbacteria bacterium CG10_big_fil_rev_8_21_14_0_10_48_11 TaxID=1975037 RepID=A0A2M8LFS9_9BACT|nr:MAG: hypothetical protein COV04_00190 [Candidatus Uhrbacteria bacterium CG10_big_fil_rev_8_21_14_0_10_48_11]